MILKSSAKKKIMVMFLILVFLVGVRFMSANDREELSLIEIGLRDLMAPLNTLAMQVISTFSNMQSSIASHADLIEENAKLKEQLRELAIQNSRMEEYRLENQRLQKMVDFKSSNDAKWEMLAGKVISRDPGNWFKNITIDKGLKDGVQKDMAVINHQGLVGKVTAVSNNTAEVMLLIDSNSVVGAMVQESRVLGVVEAITGMEYLLQMFHLSPNAPISAGDVIISSGLGGIFPKGLKIGYVAEVYMGPSRLTQFASIVPYVDFGRLEEILVIIDVENSALNLQTEEGGD